MRATVETKENPLTSFGDWNKYVTAGYQATFYGDHHHQYTYINPLSHHKISIHFKFGRPSIQFMIESLTVSQLKEISKLFTRTENIQTRSKISESYLTQPYLLDNMETDQILDNVTFSTEEVNNPVQLEYTLKTLADYTQLPKDLQHDISQVLKEQTDRQTSHMEKLSNDLLSGTPGLIQKLQNNIIIYNIHEQFGVVLRWIDYLVEQNRVNEAILWCDIIPKDIGEYYLAKQKLALQLLSDNTDLEDVVLYQNDTQVELSCQEAMFHFNYNIAKFTKDSSDEAAVIHCLNGLSAPNASLTNVLSEHYLIIQQARVISTLQNELEQLKNTAMTQSNNSGSIFGNLGIFGQSSGSESKAVQNNEEDGLSMDVFAAAFAFLNS